MTASTSARPRILCVDDEPRILTSLQMQFRREYELLLAGSAQAGLDLLKQHSVNVIVSDQRMPGATGIEFLRQARELQPSAMRILLTGYSDLAAIIGSINDGEVFRFINKPWERDLLRDTLAQAVEASKIELAAPASAGDDTRGLGVIVLDSDPEPQRAIRLALAPEVPVFAASTMEECLDLLERHPIGVLVSETRIGSEPAVRFIGALKQHHPHLVSVILTGKADAADTVDLINQGQVYRFLIKRSGEGLTRHLLHSALRHHRSLLQNPATARRFAVEASREAQAPAAGAGVLARIRGLRSRIFGSPRN